MPFHWFLIKKYVYIFTWIWVSHQFKNFNFCQNNRRSGIIFTVNILCPRVLVLPRVVSGALGRMGVPEVRQVPVGREYVLKNLQIVYLLFSLQNMKDQPTDFHFRSMVIFKNSLELRDRPHDFRIRKNIF